MLDRDFDKILDTLDQEDESKDIKITLRIDRCFRFEIYNYMSLFL